MWKNLGNFLRLSWQKCKNLPIHPFKYPADHECANCVLWSRHCSAISQYFRSLNIQRTHCTFTILCYSFIWSRFERRKHRVRVNALKRDSKLTSRTSAIRIQMEEPARVSILFATNSCAITAGIMQELFRYMRRHTRAYLGIAEWNDARSTQLRVEGD